MDASVPEHGSGCELGGCELVFRVGGDVGVETAEKTEKGEGWFRD